MIYKENIQLRFVICPTLQDSISAFLSLSVVVFPATFFLILHPPYQTSLPLRICGSSTTAMSHVSVPFVLIFLWQEQPTSFPDPLDSSFSLGSAQSSPNLESLPSTSNMRSDVLPRLPATHANIYWYIYHILTFLMMCFLVLVLLHSKS